MLQLTQDIYSYQNLSVTYSSGGEGKPVILLHGWGSSSRVMAPVARHLPDLGRFYLPDLPGFGETPEPPRPWSVDDYADLIEEFIQTTGGDQKVDLLVHSFGGRIALKLLTRRSAASRIDRVLITGGAGLKPRRSARFYLKTYTTRLLRSPIRLLPEPHRAKAEARLRETSLWKKLGSSDYRKLSGIMRETFVKCVSEHLDALLPQIDHEILLLWGEQDEATPLEQGRRMETGLRNGALVVIDQAGHYAFLDKPKQFAAIARAFFTA